MNEPLLRFTDNQPKTKIKLSTILGRGKFSKNGTLLITSVRRPNGEWSRTYKTIEKDEGTVFSYGLHAGEYLYLSGLSDALRSTAEKGPLEYMLEFTPFPEHSDILHIHVKKTIHDLVIDTETLESARKIVPWETERSPDGRILKYDFATIFVEGTPFGAKQSHCSEKKKIHFKTHLKDDQARYEEFTVLHDYIDKKTIMHAGDYVENSCSRFVSHLLDITGLGNAIKEWPPSIFMIHNGAEIRNPDEMRVVYDPFNHGSCIPILKISPTKNKLYLNQLSLMEAMQKPTRITSSPEGLELNYPFLTVLIRYDDRDDNLALYYGDSIDLGKKE